MICVVGLCNMHVTVRVRSTSAVGLFFLDKDDYLFQKVEAFDVSVRNSQF